MNQKEDFFERINKQLGVSLNEIQKKAVQHADGPLLLLASPGSGKTTTTIMRIGYLIETRGVIPSRIKAVTYSKAAANDMKERFKRFFPHYGDSVDFSTIHSLAFELVREYLYKSNISFDLIEGKIDKSSDHAPLEKKQILRKLFQKVNNRNSTDDELEELATYISFVKNKLVPEIDWSRIKCDVPNAQQILKKYELYKKSASKNLLVDYDDMLTIANSTLELDAQLLKKYQQRYDFILTDESQDTSMVQHSIIQRLVQSHQNLFVVADDDQSIYAWRAAEPQYLLNFKQLYKNAEILMMEQNYRSSKNIVDTANQFIKQNRFRYDKNMFTENPANKPIVIKNLEDYKLQSKYLVQEISNVENYHDVAVLFRNNSSVINIINDFDKANIPFYIKDHDNRFFSHWVIKDILNFMRLSFNDRRQDIFEKIYMKMNLFISKKQVVDIKKLNNNHSVFDNMLTFVELKDYQIRRIEKCKAIFQKMKGASPLLAIRIIRYQLGYEEKIENMAEELGFNKENLLGILYTLEKIAESLETMEEFAKRLKHLESLLNKSRFNKNKNVVTLSTLHSSKGLEFKKVYMVDLINGVIPTKEELTQFEKGNVQLLEESVRLFYVGMTRAEQSLELLSYQMQYGKDVTPSQFVSKVSNIISPAVKIKRDSQVSKKNTTSKLQDSSNTGKTRILTKDSQSWNHSTPSRLVQEVEQLIQKQHSVNIQQKNCNSVKREESIIDYRSHIDKFIKNKSVPVFLVSEVCHYLIKDCKASKDKYQSGKYKIFPEVVKILETLVKAGILEFAGDKGTQDRYYKKISEEITPTTKLDDITQLSLFD